LLQRPVLPLASFAAVLIVIVAAIGALRSALPARALPPGGIDAFAATGQVTALSRLGQETVQVQGSVTMQRADPHMDAGVEVANAEIIGLSLTGTSLTGPISISESAGLPSSGEFRSLQAAQQFPASSFFDTFIDVEVPASGFRTPGRLALHNVSPLRLTAAGPIAGWPPTGAKYASAPLQNVDNDGDTLIDEDTADDDLDGAYDEDPPGNGDEDTDGRVDEDGSLGVDADTDTRVDEDPNCLPLFPTLPAGVCIVAVSITLGGAQTPGPTSTPCAPACLPTPTRTSGPTGTPPPPTPTPTATQPAGPEDPTFSVAPGGPSGLHPADLLGLNEGTTAVSGNDNFAAAGIISALPFSGTQETFGATLEGGEPTNPGGCIALGSKGATVWYRYTAGSSATVTAHTIGSSFDTVLAVYTGSAVNALTPVGCDDDSEGLQSIVVFSATAGVTYRIQAGGYDGTTGTLSLSLTSGGGSGAGAPPFVRIACAQLGLSADGCDSGADGDQDDIEGLSYGSDFTGVNDDVFFSVAPGSQGLASTGVAAQAGCSPAQPQADEFGSSRDGDNALVFDGDGGGPSCPSGPTLHLTELPSSDDLDALDAHPPSYVDPDGDGTPDQPVFFSLAPGSPSLAAQSRTAGDILWTAAGFQPGVYASRATLGLAPGDAIDGLCINDTGPGGAPSFSAPDVVYFSLAAGSPSLAAIGAGAADLLSPGPEIAVARATLGLRQTDDLDAMKCAGTGGGPVTIAVGDIWFCGPAFSSGNVCETKINQGDTVVWDFTGATLPHTTTHCGASCASPTASPLWDSGVISPSSPDRTFEFTFTEPGTYLYFCEVHPTTQRGRIVVNAAGVLGDVNCGGAVDAIDALLILQFGAGLLSSLECGENGDLNGDGEINAVDAAIVLQYVAGLIDSLPP